MNYPESLSPSNLSLTAAEHLALAAERLEQESIQLLSGRQAAKFKDLAAIFQVLAVQTQLHRADRAEDGMSRFRKELLPPPRSFYEQALGKLSRPSRGWVKANCPFHQSKSHTSFSIHLDSGAFFCHGCGVKGGGIVDFVKMRDGCDFRVACKTLGCWDEGSKPIKVSTELVPYLTLDFEIDCDCYSVSVKNEPRNYAGRGFAGSTARPGSGWRN